ncbi:MAG: transposase [bacterium]
MRKDPLVCGQIYHIFTKSIAGFRVFRDKREYGRFIEMLKFYRHKSVPMKFSDFEELSDRAFYYETNIKIIPCLVEIIAYCIMPTHIHLILGQLEENGITIFMKFLLDSYTRYFNIKNDRKGPLWQSRFKSVLVDDNDYLLHLTRYIHLNPVSDNLVERPEYWFYSSYREYINLESNGLCNYLPYIPLKSDEYKEFVEIRKDYQKHLAMIKHLLLE